MVYFLQGIFLPQTHKTRSGYSLNHDVLMSVNEQTRKKLIAYFIAEQLPQKIHESDIREYQNETFHRMALPASVWTFFGILAPAYLGLVSKKALYRSPIGAPLLWICVAALSGSVFNSVVWRSCEGAMMEKSLSLNKIAEKYNFTIYDFAIAKKQSHVKRLLQVMDSHHEILHQE